MAEVRIEKRTHVLRKLSTLFLFQKKRENLLLTSWIVFDKLLLIVAARQ